MSTRLYSVADMMRLFNVQRTTVWQWSSQRRFTTYRIGGLKFNADEVDTYLEAIQQPSADKLQQMATQLKTKLRAA